MSQPLRVLIVEDNPHDAELIVRALRRAGFEPAWQRVETEAEYLDALTGELDLILSDYALPEFNGLRALELLTEQDRRIPFIIVSATIGEETAVEAIKLGAADYLLKDRLTRLGPAIEHALTEGRLRCERLAALEAQHESERLARAALDGLSAHIAILDETGTVLAVNAAWRKFGEKNGALPDRAGVGSNYLAICDRFAGPEAESVRAVAGAIRSLLAGSQAPFECEYACHAPNNQRWFVVRVTAFPGEGPRRVVVAHEDVTERKEQEYALRVSEARFRQVMENIQEVFWIRDVADGRFIYVSPGYETVWGSSCVSLYANPATWHESIHSEDRVRVAQAAGARQAAGTYHETYRIVRPDGTVRWIHDKAFPVKSEDGDITRMVGVAEDITERKELEERFLRAQRLEAIGNLAGGVAHDLNNILAPMLVIAPLVRDKLADARDRELLVMIEEGARRGAGIIKQLLTFSRGIAGERGPVQVRHQLKEMMAIMRETFPREITVKEIAPPDLWTITADATQIHQVLMNLCVNARDAMPVGGDLVLSAANVTIGETEAAGYRDAKAGDYVLLIVADTGEGIPRANIDRIFEPFFTTKKIGKGTGLGLSTVSGIVKSHGGFLQVESERGRGSEFRVFLPASREVEARVTGEAAARPGRQELILVVDDEDPIRRIMRVILERNDYRVLVASDGGEALTLFLENRDAVRLILTDLMMPGMNGLALVRAVRALGMQVPVVAMSGLHDDDGREELAALGVKAILAKPCDMADVLAAVQRALAGA